MDVQIGDELTDDVAEWHHGAFGKVRRCYRAKRIVSGKRACRE